MSADGAGVTIRYFLVVLILLLQAGCSDKKSDLTASS